MDATPNFPGQDAVGDGVRGGGDVGTTTRTTVAATWSALHQAAAVVGGLAGAGPLPQRPGERDFPSVIGRTAGWRRQIVEQGIEDLAAIMEPGLAALLDAHTRGVDPTAAARALWREFIAARDALLALAPAQDP